MENKLTNRFARTAAILLMLIMAVCCFSVRGGVVLPSASAENIVDLTAQNSVADDFATNQASTASYINNGGAWVGGGPDLFNMGSGGYMVYKLQIPAAEAIKAAANYRHWLTSYDGNGGVHQYSGSFKTAWYVTDEAVSADFNGDVSTWTAVPANEAASASVYEYTYNIRVADDAAPAETLYVCVKFADNASEYHGQPGGNDGAWIDKIQFSIDTGETVAVTGVEFAVDSKEIAYNTTEALSAAVSPENATNKQIVYTSSNPEAVIVVNGSVQAIGYGSSVITAETVDGGFTDTITYNVTGTPERKEIDMTSVSSFDTLFTTDTEGFEYIPSNVWHYNFGIKHDGGYNGAYTPVTTSYIAGIDFRDFAGYASVIYKVKIAAGSNLKINLTLENNWGGAQGVTMSGDTVPRLNVFVAEAAADGNPGEFARVDADTDWTSSKRDFSFECSDFADAEKVVFVKLKSVYEPERQGAWIKNVSFVTASDTVSVTGVAINNKIDSLGIGATHQLNVSVAPSDASNTKVTYTSSETGVATVNAAGLIKAVASGSTVITVTTEDGSFTDSFELTVTEPAVDLTIAGTVSEDFLTNQKSVYSYMATSGASWVPAYSLFDLGAGQYLVYKINIPAQGGAEVTVQFKNWAGVGNGGVHKYSDNFKTEWYVTDTSVDSSFDGNVSSWMKVNAASAASSDVFEYTYVLSDKGADKTARTVYACIKFVDNSDAYAGQGGWNDGAWIEKITFKRLTDLNVPVSGITLSETELNLGLTEKTTLTVNFTPSDATNTGIRWTSSNPAAVTVTDGGLVRAVGYGSAVITATSVDGEFTATCDVEVINTPEQKTVDMTSAAEFDTDVLNDTEHTFVLPNVWFYNTGVIHPEGESKLSTPVVTIDQNIKFRDFACSAYVIYKVVLPADTMGRINLEMENNWNGANGIVGMDQYVNNPRLNIFVTSDALTLENIADANWTRIESDGDWSKDTRDYSFVIDGLKTAERTVYVKVYNTFVSNQGAWINSLTFTTSSGAVPVESVTINKTGDKLAIGSTMNVSAVINPSDAGNTNVTWSSSDNTIAEISASGVITGKKAGKVTITVTTEDGNKTDSFELTVFDSSVVDLEQNVNVTDDIKTSRGLTYAAASSDSFWNNDFQLFNIGSTVDTSGGWVAWKIKLPEAHKLLVELEFRNWVGIGNGGVHVDGLPKLQYYYTTDVSSVPSGSSSGWTETGRDVNWDTEIFNYNFSTGDIDSATGEIYFMVCFAPNGSGGGDGAWLDSISFTAVSSANVPVTGVALDRTELTLNYGAKVTLKASLQPSNASNRDVTWSSSDPSIVYVDSHGTLEAVGAGTATITVTTTDGSHTATCTVTVPDGNNDSIIDLTDGELFDTDVMNTSESATVLPNTWFYSSGTISTSTRVVTLHGRTFRDFGYNAFAIYKLKVPANSNARINLKMAIGVDDGQYIWNGVVGLDAASGLPRLNVDYTEDELTVGTIGTANWIRSDEDGDWSGDQADYSFPVSNMGNTDRYVYVRIYSTMVSQQGAWIEALTFDTYTPEPSGISVKKPNKTSYKVGETLDLTGMVVSLRYNDGSSVVLNSDEYTVDKTGALTAEDKEVVITYGSFSTKFSITVSKIVKSIAITKNPVTEYTAGDYFDPSGIEITVTYEDNTTEVITKGYSYDKKNVALQESDTQVVFTYEDKTATLTITVSPEENNNNNGDTPPADESGLSAGAIIGIVAACVVVIGGGAAAFIIVKKKRA